MKTFSRGKEKKKRGRGILQRQAFFNILLMQNGRKRGILNIENFEKRTGKGLLAMGKSGWFEALKQLSWLTQLGFSMVAPVLLCTGGALWLQNKFSLGAWVVLAGLAVGLVSGGCTFVSFLKYAQKQAEKPWK